jgi:hypothetical protein
MVGVDHSSYYWGQEQWLCGVENTQAQTAVQSGIS